MQFRTFDDWITVCVGKAEITVNSDDTVSHIRHGRTCRTGSAARAYIDARPKLAEAVRNFYAARREAVEKWKRETPHHRYTCEGGAFAVRVNGATIKIGNGYGDGDFPVYVIADNISSPPEFRTTGVSVDGPVSIEVLDHDCVGGKVVETVVVPNGHSAWFSVGLHGAVSIEVL